jgi:PTS system nitrogen regulatory IIA component
MDQETMDLEQLARYLRRDARELAQLANRGYLPGRKVGGQWRFSRPEITQWVEKQMHAFTEQELASLEGNRRQDDPELIVGTLLPRECLAVPLQARTKTSVLAELVATAEKSWQIYDPEAILQALKQREEMASTALENGVAIPHPHRPLPGAVGDTVVAYGRTPSGIPFGGPRGVLTDIFFLVCARDDRSHLRTLARLSRMLLRPTMLEELRDADSAAESFDILLRAEKEVLGR